MESTLIYVLIGAVIPYILGKLGIKVPPVPSPNGPPTPSDFSALITQIIKSLLEQLLPSIQEIVRTEVAARPPIKEAVAPVLPVTEVQPDGSVIVRIPASAVASSPATK